MVLSLLLSVPSTSARRGHSLEPQPLLWSCLQLCQYSSAPAASAAASSVPKPNPHLTQRLRFSSVCNRNYSWGRKPWSPWSSYRSILACHPCWHLDTQTFVRSLNHLSHNAASDGCSLLLFDQCYQCLRVGLPRQTQDVMRCSHPLHTANGFGFLCWSPTHNEADEGLPRITEGFLPVVLCLLSAQGVVCLFLQLSFASQTSFMSACIARCPDDWAAFLSCMPAVMLVAWQHSAGLESEFKGLRSCGVEEP